MGSLRMGRTVGCFTASSALSLLGNSIAAVVIPLVLLERTGDALAAGTLALVCAVPQVVMGVVGGAALDRINRRTVSLVSDVVSASSMAALFAVDATVGLSFWWFALFGVIGAVGDVPGLTARDTLAPAACEHDGIDLKRYLGIRQSIEALVTIVGPAVAAGIVAFGGGTGALLATAALSLGAAMVTCGIPRAVGAVHHGAEATEKAASAGVLALLLDGLRALFGSGAKLRGCVVLTYGLMMVMGGYQGLVLPVHCTEIGEPALLGVMLSALAGGVLAGSLFYSATTPRLSSRAWYVASLTGMLAGLTVMGLLPPAPLLLAGSFLLGFASGPISALLGFLVLDLIPDERRGIALGTQNALLLVVSPLSVFGTSVLVEALGTSIASASLAVIWALVTAWAIFTPALRKL